MGSGPERRRRILVADDERSVRDLTKRMLERAGYEVVAVEDGMQAYETATDGVGSFDLLFFDVVMPRMGGRDAADRIRAHHPEMPVIFTSGFVGKGLDGQSAIAEGERFLPKPYSPSELLAIIREALSEGEAR